MSQINFGSETFGQAQDLVETTDNLFVCVDKRFSSL